MKFNLSPELSQFNCILDGLDCGNAVIYGKIEQYICTRTLEDEQLSKELEQRLQQDHKNRKKDLNGGSNSSSAKARPVNVPYGSSIAPVLSPHVTSPTSPYNKYAFPVSKTASSALSPQSASPTCHSPFGALTSSANRSVFVDLIATLNSSFHDYDFRAARPEDFTKEASMEHVFNSINLSLRDALNAQSRADLWKTMDKIVALGDCDIFTYNSDDSDPMALGDGKIWCWNYFFYNKKQKKLLFFTCYAKSKVSFTDMSDNDSDHDAFYSNPKNANFYFRGSYSLSSQTQDDDDDLDDMEME